MTKWMSAWENIKKRFFQQTMIRLLLDKILTSLKVLLKTIWYKDKKVALHSGVC